MLQTSPDRITTYGLGTDEDEDEDEDEDLPEARAWAGDSRV